MISCYDDFVIKALANSLIQVINSHHKFDKEIYWRSYQTASVWKKMHYLQIHNQILNPYNSNYYKGQVAQVW